MCILYYVGPDKDEFPTKPWIMTSSEGFAKNYASETNGRVFSKELPPRKVILPGEIPEDAKKALKAVEEHTNIMMANRKAGKAGFTDLIPTRQNNAVSDRVHSGAVPSDVPNTPPAPDTETPSVFPLSEVDKLKMEIANLEERIKDMKFELNDKDITIRELKAQIGGR